MFAKLRNLMSRSKEKQQVTEYTVSEYIQYFECHGFSYILGQTYTVRQSGLSVETNANLIEALCVLAKRGVENTKQLHDLEISVLQSKTLSDFNAVKKTVKRISELNE